MCTQTHGVHVAVAVSRQLLQALPSESQPLTPSNASTLSEWICEGPKGIDGKLKTLLPTSHTLVLWAAAVCRVCGVNVFMLAMTGRVSGLRGGGVVAAVAVRGRAID
jgi:hypothetical protein